MSEYQCYQWKRVGRSLSPDQRRQVSALSSHITVSSDSAEVSYEWGDFKHDPLQVLDDYFDLFLYEANWGTQRVAFRFGVDSVDRAELERFAVEDVVTVAESDDRVLVEAWFDENWVEPAAQYDDAYAETDWRLDAFGAIYRQVTEGDYRGLFLLWLKACEWTFGEESTQAVALPKGMAQLGDEHRVLAEFVGVEDGLLAQAAERSSSLPKKGKEQEQLHRLLDKLSHEKREAYLQRLLVEDAVGVQSALKHELRSLGGQPRVDLSGRVVSYAELANGARLEAERDALRLKAEKERRRREYLAGLAKREDALWDRVHALVSEKKTKSYGEAVLLLRGLEDLSVSREDRAHFLNGVKLIAGQYPRLIGFRGRLEEAGMIEAKKEERWLEGRRERWLANNPLEREIDLKKL